MGKHAVELLEAFESLPSDDKQAFAVEILRRPGNCFDSGPLDDQEIGETGRRLFALLDREEHDSEAR